MRMIGKYSGNGDILFPKSWDCGLHDLCSDCDFATNHVIALMTAGIFSFVICSRGITSSNFLSQKIIVFMGILYTTFAKFYNLKKNCLFLFYKNNTYLL